MIRSAPFAVADPTIGGDVEWLRSLRLEEFAQATEESIGLDRQPDRFDHRVERLPRVSVAD